MLRMRGRCRAALVAPRAWSRPPAFSTTAVNDREKVLSATVSAPHHRRRSRSTWRTVAVATASVGLLLGLTSSTTNSDGSIQALARRKWLILRSGWVLSTAFVAHTDFQSDLLGGGGGGGDNDARTEAEEAARASRRIQWWGAIQRANNHDATTATIQEKMILVLLHLMAPQASAVNEIECESLEDVHPVIKLLVDRGVLPLLVDYVAIQKPTNPEFLKQILACLHVALDEATTRDPDPDTSDSNAATTTFPSRLSLVLLGASLDHLLDQEAMKFSDLIHLGQRLLQLEQQMDGDFSITQNRMTNVFIPHTTDDEEFRHALHGFVRLLSPEMPPTLKEFAMTSIPRMVRAATHHHHPHHRHNGSASTSTRQLDAVLSPVCATFLLALPRGNAHLQQCAAKMMASLLEAAVGSLVPISPDVYDLWIQQIRTWLITPPKETSGRALQLAGARCLRILSSHPRTRQMLCESTESMNALFQLARQLHEDTMRPPPPHKKQAKETKTKTKTKQGKHHKKSITAPPDLDDDPTERALIQRHLSRTFMNICTGFQSGDTAMLETVDARSGLFHSRRTLPMSRVFRGAHDLTDLPVVGADEYETSTEFGWSDILTQWTGSRDRETRENAIHSLVHLVEQDSATQLGRDKQRHLLQAWLTSMLQHVRNITGGGEILAIKQVEEIARISDEFTPGNEEILFNPAVVDAGVSALAVLAEQHADELINYGVVPLVSLVAAKCASHDDAQFDFTTQAARVVANLVGACCKSLEAQQEVQAAPVGVLHHSSQPRFGHDNHPLWRPFFTEVFDVNRMLGMTSSGHKLQQVFHTWQDKEDPHERSQLFRALANIEAYKELSRCGERTLPVYAEGVHPIVSQGTTQDQDHKQENPFLAAQNANVDIVFVHGLRGDAFGTWRTDMGDSIDARTDIWPDILLDKDLQQAGIHSRVLSLGYEANMVSWSSPWPSMTLQERASVMLQALYDANVGRQHQAAARPVVFVTHSMGGILVKKILLLSKTSAAAGTGTIMTTTTNSSHEEKQQPLADRTKGVVFLAVPHFGSDLARSVRSEAVRSLLKTHPALQDLCASHDRRLESLNDSFAELQIDCLSIAEQKPAPLGFGLSAMVVKPESANPGFGEFFVLPDADHMTICKAKTREDPMYSSVLKYILRHVNVDDENAPEQAAPAAN